MNVDKLLDKLSYITVYLGLFCLAFGVLFSGMLQLEQVLNKYYPPCAVISKPVPSTKVSVIPAPTPPPKPIVSIHGGTVEKVNNAVKKFPVNGRLRFIDLGQEIGPQDKYKQIYDTIINATPQDIIVLELHNKGGLVDTMVYLLNAIEASRGYIVADIQAPCYSAGAVIASYADRLYFRNHSFLMFHNGSTDISGKSSDVNARLGAEERSFRDILQGIADRGIIKQKDVDDIVNGKDVYVFPKDIMGISRTYTVRYLPEQIFNKYKPTSVQTVFNQLKRVAGTQELKLNVFKDPDVNIYTNGYTVSISTGTLNIMGGDTDEMAAVLAHEIYHVINGDTSNPNRVWRHEFNADTGGISIANRAGFNGKKGACEFLHKILSRYGNGSDEEHPSVLRRIQNIGCN